MDPGPLIAQGGLGILAAFLFYAWMDERRQRQKRDDQIIEMSGRLVPLASSMTATLDRFGQTVSTTLQHAAPTPSPDLAQVLKALEVLSTRVDDIGKGG